MKVDIREEFENNPLNKGNANAPDIVGKYKKQQFPSFYYEIFDENEVVQIKCSKRD